MKSEAKAKSAERAKNLWFEISNRRGHSPYISTEEKKLLDEHGYAYQKPDDVDF
jgi:hypothetical protein